MLVIMLRLVKENKDKISINLTTNLLLFISLNLDNFFNNPMDTKLRNPSFEIPNFTPVPLVQVSSRQRLLRWSSLIKYILPFSVSLEAKDLADLIDYLLSNLKVFPWSIYNTNM